MWLKEIRVKLRPGQAHEFWQAQSVWNGESAQCAGYLGTIEARPDKDQALLLVFWKDRDSLDRFMRNDHDRIAAVAHSDAYYESICVRQFEVDVVEESLARAFRDQST
jgi:heme-degrading monooxygenase HmoA